MRKKAAMEMSVGTIVTIVLLMSVLVLGIFLVQKIFSTSSDSVDIIDSQLKGEINNLFGSSDKDLVVMLGEQNTAKIKQGTANFGIPIGFSPDDPSWWGSNNQGCKYSVEPVNQPTYCIRQGWASVEQDVKTGTQNVIFDEVDGLNGFALIKIDVPETLAPCLQRFSVEVSCTGAPRAITTFFDVDVIKSGLF